MIDQKQTILRCENVSFSYDGSPVVSGLDFTVREGEYLCIIGENGSGKSTLVRGLLGLKQPSSGRIVFEGGLRLQDIGYLPQQTAVQRDFPASVREVVLSGCQSSGRSLFYTGAQKQAARDAMKRLDILELQNRCYRELSGGQQQRVLLARALCSARRALLLDEPTAGLDPAVTQVFYQLVEELSSRERMAVIMVSHDLDYVCRKAEKILYIKEKQEFFGEREAFLQSEPSGFFQKDGKGGEKR